MSRGTTPGASSHVWRAGCAWPLGRRYQRNREPQGRSARHFAAWSTRELQATTVSMKAFIQHSGGLPTNVNTYTALRGFELLGADIEPFTFEELESGVLPVS